MIWSRMPGPNADRLKDGGMWSYSRRTAMNFAAASRTARSTRRAPCAHIARRTGRTQRSTLGGRFVSPHPNAGPRHAPIHTRRQRDLRGHHSQNRRTHWPHVYLPPGLSCSSLSDAAAAGEFGNRLFSSSRFRRAASVFPSFTSASTETSRHPEPRRFPNPLRQGAAFVLL